MATPPFAAAQATINGGSLVTGSITVTSNQTVQLSGTNTTGWQAQVWEIYDSPPGFNPGGTWTLAADGLTWQNTSVTPPSFSTGATWGKWMIRLRVNGNPLSRNADSSPNAAFVSQLTDESMSLRMASVNGLQDTGFLETSQNSAKGFVGDIQGNWRTIDGGLGAGWKVAYELDFTQQSTQTISADGNATIGGLTWTKLNSANENVHATITNGTGLVLQPKQALWTSNTAPRLWLPFSSMTLLSSAYDHTTQFRVWVSLGAETYRQAQDSVFFGFDTGTPAGNSVDYGVSFRKVFTGGIMNAFGDITFLGGGGMATSLWASDGVDTLSGGVSKTLLGMSAPLLGSAVMSCPWTASLSAGAAFPAANTLKVAGRSGQSSGGGGAQGVYGQHSTDTVATMGFVIGAYAGGATTGVTFTIQRVRVEYRL